MRACEFGPWQGRTICFAVVPESDFREAPPFVPDRDPMFFRRERSIRTQGMRTPCLQSGLSSLFRCPTPQSLRSDSWLFDLGRFGERFYCFLEGHSVLRIVPAQQGARANAHVCHGSCWRTLRASRRRGSSLTLGVHSREKVGDYFEGMRIRTLAGTNHLFRSRTRN